MGRAGAACYGRRCGWSVRVCRRGRAYVDSEGAILELHDLEPLNETPVPAASDNVQYVLEMNRGWFKRHNIGVGAVMACDAGKLKDAFRFGR